MKRKICVLAFMMVFAFVFCMACLPAFAADSGGVLKYAYNYADMDLLDVHKHTTTDVMQAANPIGESLIRVEMDGSLRPLLLETMPEMSPDGTLFTFKLKKGVKFHDGTELRAASLFSPIRRAQ